MPRAPVSAWNQGTDPGDLQTVRRAAHRPIGYDKYVKPVETVNGGLHLSRRYFVGQTREWRRTGNAFGSSGA